MNESDWLGDVSEAPRNVGGRPAKDYSARGNRKIECPDCGFIARCSAASIERAGGLPSCACGAAMIVPNLRDRAVIEWDALEAELTALGVERDASGKVIADPFADAMRELGFDGMVISPYGNRRGGATQTRCEASGCHKYSAGRYCPEHEHERPAMGSAYKGRA